MLRHGLRTLIHRKGHTFIAGVYASEAQSPLRETLRGRKLKERKFGYAKGFFKMSADFDKPLEDFKDYM